MSAATPLPSVQPALSPRLVNPWKGLHFYTEEDHDLFFGRGQVTEEFLRLVQRDTLSVLFARSGLGKTSLLRAGVSPRLREEGFLPVILRVDYAASALPPARQIVDATLAAAAEVGIDVEKTGESVAASSQEDGRDTLWEFFHRRQFWGKRNDLVVPVLILDQFEEVFTLGRQSPHTAEFLAQLADLAENRMPQSVQQRTEATGERLAFDTRAQNYRVILSLREDFVAKLDSLRPLMPTVMRNRFALAPLDGEGGVEVIRRAGGQWVSQTVALEIVTAVAGESKTPEQQVPAYNPGAEIEPAYLSVMCHELFERMRELDRNEIGSDLVQREHGNILDALYERSFEGLDPKTRLFVEDRLLTASGFRGTVPLVEAGRDGISTADLENLVNRRLLRFEDRLGTTHVELSHDLLTRVVRTSRDKRQAKAAWEAQRKQEEELRAKLCRSRLHALAAAGTAMALLGVIGFYAFGWVIPYHSLCRGFTKRWGVIYPIGPLPTSAVVHRSWTLRLTRQGWFGAVQRVAVIDAHHQLTAKHPIETYLADPEAPSTQREKESRYEFVYDRWERIVYEVAWNRFDQMTWGFVHAPHKESAGGRPVATKAMFLDSDGYPRPQGHSRAEFIEIHYDARGFEAELRYSDEEGHPMPGPDNAYGQRREYDEQGRMVRLTSLNELGQPMNDAAGNAGLEIKYDQDGNMIEQRAFDAKGEPTLVKAGYYRSMSQYDKWGRETERRFFNLSGDPAIETEETGAHRITWGYDDRGNVTSIKLYDTADQATVAGAGNLNDESNNHYFPFPAHEQRQTFDEQNRAETTAYFDQDGKPLTGPEGWHARGVEYDKRGFVSAIISLDGQNNPVNETSTGAHRWERVNDAFGQPIEERFFDTERKAVAILDGGYHLRKNEYDKAGNLTVQTYFDAGNNPVADLTVSAHRVVKSFDRFRHPMRRQYFDEAGQPINNKQGFHLVESKYDDYGSELGRRWYDKDGHPSNGPDGVHYINYTYDSRGLLARVARYDDDAGNQPVADNDGIHETLCSYNDKRQQTRWQVFGLNRKPAEDEEGDHLVLKEFDERGRATKITRLRADGSPNWDRELGIATRIQMFDSENRWIEQAYYDAEDHLVTGPHGFAKGSNVYHSDSRVEYHLFGPDGNPALNPLAGYAIKKTDPRNRGDTTETYHGPDGALITGPEGYAEVHRRWSNEGVLLSVAWFGPDGAPVAGPAGYHRAERGTGASEVIKYFDTQNRELPSLGPDAVVSIIYINEISDIKQPAAKAGLHVGDIPWRYGNWVFPDVLAAERSKGTEPDAIPAAVAQALFAERDRLSMEPAPMTVIRDRKPVTITMPPLPAKAFGMRLVDRAVPVATFEEWKAVAAE